MLKHFLAGLLLLLSFIPAIGQEYWSTVPAPTQAPYVQPNQTGHSQVSDYTWKYPFTRPTPAGVIRVYNAIVDADGKIGTWSQPTTLTVQSGWRLWGGAWNQPVVEDASGIAWKLEIVSVDPSDPTGQWQYNPYYAGRVAYLYTGWNGSYIPNTLSPVSSHNPYLQQLTEDATSSYTIERIGEGGRYTTVSSAPVVVAASIPHRTYQLAYCRVTETGETALSPAYTFTPSYPAGTVPSDASWLRCSIYEYHPQGTLGLHFYRRELIASGSRGEQTWGEWKRLPDAECYGTPSTPDDWLHPIWKRTLLLLRYVDDAPVHAPAVNPQSRLTDLHRLLRGDPVKDKDVLERYGLPTNKTYVGDVIVSPKQRFTATCPVIDEWGNGDSGSTGGESDQKFHRRIRASDFGEWFIDQQPSQSGHKSWPVVLIHNQYSRWTACSIKASGGDALAYSDYSGGQAFGNQFRECKFDAPMSIGGRVTCGIRIDHNCAPSHHPSEQLFSDCYSKGGIAVMLGGNQAANIRFDRLHANSNCPDPRGSVFYINNPNPIRFLNGLYCDAYITSQMLLTGQRGVTFRCSGYHADLQIEDIWVDTGFVRFIEANGIACQLDLTGGKLNTRGTKPVLGLFTGVTPVKSTWAITKVQTQPDPGTQPCRIINLNYRTVEPLLERTGLADLVLREPGDATALTMLRKFAPNGQLSPKPELGYRVPVADGFKVINSLTNGTAVSRELYP